MKKKQKNKKTVTSISTPTFITCSFVVILLLFNYICFVSHIVVPVLPYCYLLSRDSFFTTFEIFQKS